MDSFFRDKPFVLGWAVAKAIAVPLDDTCFHIPITKFDDKNVVNLIQHTAKCTLENECADSDVVGSFSITSSSMKDIIHAYDRSLSTVGDDDEHKWTFVRGVFCAAGSIPDSSYRQDPIAQIECPHHALLDAVRRFCGIPASILATAISSPNSMHTMKYRGVNAVDFLGFLYPTNPCPLFSQDHNILFSRKCVQNYNAFRRWLRTTAHSVQWPVMEVFREDPNAIVPTKVRLSDVGFDLTIIKFHKKLTETTSLYDTGVRLSIPFGFYAEIVPRSSLSKSGHVLANSIGIIDPGYRSNIYVALAKVDPSAPDISFPFRCCQIILKRQEHAHVEEVFSELSETDRGAGGFGSTSS